MIITDQMANHPVKEKLVKKASFKCAGPYRTRKKLSSSVVQELTLKFNQIAAAQGKPQNVRVVICRPGKKPKTEPPATDTMPVKTAIDYFEGKPVATIKPILKETMEKSTKPKLTPKDSLCRLRYSNMRRTKSPERKQQQQMEDKAIFTQISKASAGQIEAPSGQRKFAQILSKNENKENSDVDPPVKLKSDEDMPVLIPSQLEHLVQTKIDLSKISENRIATTCKTGHERRFASLLKNHVKTENLKPNASFLWSQNLTTQKPLPKPPENFIPELFYDRIPAESDSDSDENFYDDVSSKNEKNLSESLYCISDDVSTFNIYEDIQSLRLAVKNAEKTDCYDLNSVVYESIYNEVLGQSSECSDHTGSERINSLYGALPICRDGNDIAATDEQSINTEEANLCNASKIYDNASEISDSNNSDEWIEISDSETEQTVYIYHQPEKLRKRSPKKGKYRSKLQKKALSRLTPEEISADDHVYECIPTEKSAVIDNNSSSNDVSTVITDDSICVDDFESSEDECPDAQLPAEPVQTHYKITKSLKTAGQKLRKNLTLRKSDLGRSLKKLEKLRPRLRNDTFEKSANGSTFYCDIIPQQKSSPVRPSGPPPPPPNSAEISPITGDTVKYADLKLSHSSALYKEIGVFTEKPSKSGSNNSSIYSELGLYGADESSAENYGIRGKLFADEPLYQFYTECVNAQARDDILKHYDSDGYEAINDYYQLVNDKRRTLDFKVPGPNLQDFGGPDAPEPKQRPSFCVQNRSLWCQMPAVEESCIAATLTEKQRQFQEAKFEILTSEGSYMHSLTVLENHFMPKLSGLLSSRDQRLLFSNILAVKAESELLLADLEQLWMEDIMLTGICDIVMKHAKESHNVYLKFCKHHRAMYVTLRTLIDSNQQFSATLRELENSTECQNLSLHSFLLLPIQRITRIPLLLGAVLARLQPNDEEYESCKKALACLNQVVTECDDEARRMEKCEEMLVLSQQLDFREGIRRIPIISGSRSLVKRGSAVLLGPTKPDYKPDSKLTFGRRLQKTHISFLLFTDLLVIAKVKGNRNLLVVDYCPRNLVQLEIAENLNYLTNSCQKNLAILTLLENFDSKTAEMVVSFDLESDRQRWIDAICPKLSGNPDESIYEEWDCPQVIAIYEFTATQPDELSICIGDIVNVLKKISDGWYQGERLRDGARGWFPGNYTQEISSAHVRAKNKKQRYKLLALSGNYIQQCQNKMTGLS